MKIFIVVNDRPTTSQIYEVSLASWITQFTWHPTQVNTRHLSPSQSGRHSIYRPRRDKRL